MYTYSNRNLGDGFGGAIVPFAQKLGKVRNAVAHRQRYCRRTGKLSLLRVCELRDLEIPRDHIKRLTWETAYGN